MSTPKKSVQVEVTTDDVQEILEKLIKSPNAKILAEVIMGNICTTEVGLEQVYLAIQGIRRVSKIRPMDHILVPFSYLPSWRMNETLTREKCDVKNDMMRAVVIEVNPFRRANLLFKFSYIDGKTGELKEDEYELKETEDVILDEETILEDDDNKPF